MGTTVNSGLICSFAEADAQRVQETQVDSHQENFKRADGVAQVVEHMLNNHEVLSSNSTQYCKREGEAEGEGEGEGRGGGEGEGEGGERERERERERDREERKNSKRLMN
jgi:hypothetical protein